MRITHRNSAPLGKRVVPPEAAAPRPSEAAPPVSSKASKPADGRARCGACTRRLPLTAFLQCKCRCGGAYCGEHLHAHECQFDFKSAQQRQQLAAAHPKLSAPKLR